MANKEVSHQFNLVGSTSVTNGTTITSSASGVIYRDAICYQVNFSGNPQGYVNIRSSSDYSPGYTQGPQGSGALRAGNWASIASVSVVGSNSPVIFDIGPISMPWIQCQFVCTSGSGVVDVWTTAKAY